MRYYANRGLAALAAAAFSLSLASAQTFTKCNPTEKSCPADPALGRSVSIDLTAESDQFKGEGSSISYGADGAQLTVAKSGDSPTLISNWYIMFGRVEAVIQAAPGTGIVSSSVLQSDDLDEIDWEWLGADAAQVQTNYFGKGVTGSYNRGGFTANPTSQSSFNTYTIDWTPTQITWSINGQTVRTLTPQEANAGGNSYPQSPMQIKIGAWSGGDSSNAQGTIQWAGGPTNYAAGPYTMKVKSISVQDYSTGQSYSYGDTSGTWQSIKSSGGSVNSNSGSSGSSPPASESSAPAITQSSPATAPTTIPGLPSGWYVTSSGKVRPVSSGSATSLPASQSSAPPSLVAPPLAGGNNIAPTTLSLSAVPGPTAGTGVSGGSRPNGTYSAPLVMATGGVSQQYILSRSALALCGVAAAAALF